MKHWMRSFAVSAAVLASATGATTALASSGSAHGGSSPSPSLNTTTKRTSAHPAVGVVTISPLSGDREALPTTQISFLGAPSGALSQITVVGSSSGRHTGRLRGYVSQTGASFIPFSHFSPGEHVTVRAVLNTAKGARHLATFFIVATPRPVVLTGFPVAGNPKDVQSFQSRPDLKPPTITISQAAGKVAPGLLFSSPDLGPGQPGPLIYDNNGQVVWTHPLPGDQASEDFRTQSYGGKTVMTWWEGKILRLGYGLGKDIIMNSGYHTVATLYGGNGLAVDGHEFLLTPQGSAFVTEYSPVSGDISSVGGPKSATILEGVVQEIDVKTKLVMYEWHSLDHVPVNQSYSAAPTPASSPYDYFHINSIDVDRKGNPVISARNSSALYSISAHSGNLLWRLGGKASTLTQGANVPFAFQHNALVLPNGQLSLFDDDCCAKFGPGAPPQPAYQPNSRGEVVSLDLKNHQATLVRQFVHMGAKPLITASQGNLQPLPNGNWMVGWGGLPNFTEFDSTGQMVFDGTFPGGENSYRTYRLPWTAQPSTTPNVVAQPSGSGLKVYVSWNGATTVASWKVLGGTSPSSLTAVASAPRSGFETTIPTAASPYVVVQALSPSGRVLATSHPVHAGL